LARIQRPSMRIAVDGSRRPRQAFGSIPGLAVWLGVRLRPLPADAAAVSALKSALQAVQITILWLWNGRSRGAPSDFGACSAWRRVAKVEVASTRRG
jgi:hypothetical protein